MGYKNPFLHGVDKYKRDYNIVRAEIRQLGKAISTSLDIPYEDACNFVAESMQGKHNPDFALKDPSMVQLVKVKRGTREPSTTTFLNYIKHAVEQGRIISPSLVAYLRPDQYKSVTAEWQDDNIALRRVAKNRMFVLGQKGDINGAQLADYDQNAKKIRINTVSGMRGFSGNPLFLATGHSTLTSTCRAAAGYGNAIIERFVGGARHYHDPEIIKANIFSIITTIDLDEVKVIMDKYDLHYPSVEDTISLIRLSSDMYLKKTDYLDELREMLSKLTPIELAGFCYTGDLYHLDKFNPDFVMGLLNDLIALELDDEIIEEPTKLLKGLSGTDKAYIYALCAEQLTGKVVDEVLATDPEATNHIAKVAKKVMDQLTKYSDLISVFFSTMHLPPTVASIKGITRRVALAADTDSAIFTTQYWVKRYQGHLKRTPNGDKIWYLVTYMGCQCIANALAILSANMGVERDMIFRLSMKNEYAFAQFALTSMAKHYFSTMTMREGNVFEKPEIEIKGVGLRGSKTPIYVLKDVEQIMIDILATADRGELVDDRALLKHVADQELRTIRSIMKGEFEFLSSDSIKPNTNKEWHYTMWEYVFAPKYGKSSPPPYPGLKVSTELDNKTKLNEWVKEVKKMDPAMGGRLERYLQESGKTALKTLILPTMELQASGVPKEILPAIDLRRLSYQVNSPYYMILETLGLPIVDSKHYRLVFDFLGMEI